MNLYRCLRPTCEGKPDFWAAHPVCPSCGLDARHERFKAFVVKLEIVHFDPPLYPDIGVGKNVRACDGQPIQSRVSSAMQSMGHLGTGATAAVTCPKCRETVEYKAALGELVEPAPTFAKAACCGLGPEEF